MSPSSPAGPHRHRPRPDRDRGASFIEILVTVVLLGTSGVAVLTAVGAAALGAATHRSVAEAQAAVSAAADELVGSSVPFVACASPDDYAQQLPGELDVDVVGVQHWQSGSWDTDCDPATDTMQLVTVQATSGERGVSTLRAVKRLPSDPDAEYVMNQEAGAGVPVIPTEPTPGIDGTTTTTTTTPPTTTTTVPPTTEPPPAEPPAPTTTSTTTTTTTLPGRIPTCAVERIRVNKWWLDSIEVVVDNDTDREYAWTEWSVRLRYEGVGVEQNGFFVSTWDKDVLTLTPAWFWLPLRDGLQRQITVLEPGGSLGRLDTNDVECEVVVR